MDLSNLSRDDLTVLLQRVDVQIKKAEQLEREEAVRAIFAIAELLGKPLEEIIGDAKPRARKPWRQATEYRDPQNPQNVWGGRGPRPPWLKQALKQGVVLSSFAVRP